MYTTSTKQSTCADRTPANNVALQNFEKRQTDAQSVVSKFFSDEFFGSFFAENHEVLMHAIKKPILMHKKERPVVPSDGKVAGWENRLKRSKTIHTPFPSTLHLLLLTTFFVSVFICFSGAAKAQSRQDVGAAEAVTPLIVGQKVPEEFWTKEHLFYVNGDTVRKTLEEHKGKLLVLDFWATWCGACRVNFKKLELLKEQFGAEVDFVLVNPLRYRDTYSKIERAYREFQVQGGSSLASVISDQYLVSLFPHVGIPRYVWISPKARFIASTTNLFVDSTQIQKIMEGKY